jgi:hypothetical protein
MDKRKKMFSLQPPKACCIFVFTLIFWCVLIQTTMAKSAEKYANKPFQIARPSDNHLDLEIVREGITRLSAIREPIVIISITGGYHSGKSFLLNSLLAAWHTKTVVGADANNKMSDAYANFFAVADQVEPKTLGVWLLVTDVVTEDGVRIVLMDTEGFFGHDVSDSYDAKVFTIAALSSSVLMYNSARLIDQQSVEHLEILSRRAQLFQIKNSIRSSYNSSSPDATSSNDNSAQNGTTTIATLSSQKALVASKSADNYIRIEFPHLIFTVEDFVQDLGGRTATEWLEQYVQGRRDQTTSIARDAASLQQVFPKGIQCHTLFLPSTKLGELKNLGIVPTGALEEQYVHDVFALRQLIANKIARPAGTSPGAITAPVRTKVTGGDAALLFTFLLENINRETFPSVPSLWGEWMRTLAQHSQAEIETFYKERMTLFLATSGSSPPRSASELEERHQFLAQQSEKNLRAMLFDVVELYSPITTQLARTIASLGAKYAERNAEAVDRYGQLVVSELVAAVQEEIAKSIALPRNPRDIEMTRESTAFAWNSRYVEKMRVYANSSTQGVYERHRRSLSSTIDSTFSNLMARNEQLITEALLGASGECFRAYDQSLKQTLHGFSNALTNGGNSNYGGGGGVVEKIVATARTPMPRTREEMELACRAANEACDLARDVFIIGKSIAPSSSSSALPQLPLINDKKDDEEGEEKEEEKQIKTFSSSSLAFPQWIRETSAYKKMEASIASGKDTRAKEAHAANVAGVEQFAQEAARSIVSQARQETTYITPFPDEEEVLQKKVQSIKVEMLDKYITAVSKYTEFRSVTAQGSTLTQEITTIMKETLERNVEAVKTASFYPLKCAREKLLASECTLCSFSVWALQSHASKIADDCFSKFPDGQKFALALRNKAVLRWLETDMASEMHHIWMKQVIIAVTTILVMVFGSFAVKSSSRRSTSSSRHATLQK